MRLKILLVRALVLAFVFGLSGLTVAQQPGSAAKDAPQRPQGPCDVYAVAGDPCVAAHSTTRALYASYDGPLYRVLRQSDGKMLDIGVVNPSARDAGGYADAAAQDRFCADTYCWITTVYDQSGHHNDLTQAPRGGFSGPALGGFNNVPLADMAPITIMGHKAYGVFIEPGMGLRKDDATGTAVDDQAEGQYWVINGAHFNSGCCFDYGNAETDSRDDDNGTMETAYFGDAPFWYHGNPPGPWVMTDQENNLVGCVNPDGTKLCPNLPNITWRFVTAIAKGEPHHWTSMGGDADGGPLSVMFDGPRVNATYDPMRKQGAILLGNGGDNSNGSQGTFYEGAMTAAGTFPADATDQLVQANIVAARYGVQQLSLAPASAVAAPPGLQKFTPGSSQESTVTFTNTTGAPVEALKLNIAVPDKQWSVHLDGSTEAAKLFAGPITAGASVSATFNVTSGKAAFNGDLVAGASWTNPATGAKMSETAAEKVRNAGPITVNEFRISGGSVSDATDSFIELYNSGESDLDISKWTLTLHPTQQAIFSSIAIPPGTKLSAHGFYLLGLANSGLALPARAGESTVHVRNTTGISVGDTVTIGAGSNAETRTIAKIGTAAETATTLWQPLPEGPIIEIPAGSTNVPVASVEGFEPGEKIALGYGATYPSVARDREGYEVATVTAVGKPGTQAYLAADAPAGSTSIYVTSVASISVGDKIRLDIDSVGHGIETVTVAKVGTPGIHTNLAADASIGATNIKVRNVNGFEAGEKLLVGTPANSETVTIATVGTAGPTGSGIEFTAALVHAHVNGEGAVYSGTGLELSAPLKLNHSANLPFSDRGTGITFEPASAFAHSSNEPVQALGDGITLDKPLAKPHEINDVVRDAAVTTSGYQGSPEPNQWFGGPELATHSPLFGRIIIVRQGSMVLRDAAGLVVDSLNYGGLVDPWAAEGYQARSGMEQSGCYAPAPGLAIPAGPFATEAAAVNMSAGRFPDGADAASNCSDFQSQAASFLAVGAGAGATNIKVASVADFSAGQTIGVDTGANRETAVIAAVGSAGATTLKVAASGGDKVIHVANLIGFNPDQTIVVGDGADGETAQVSLVGRRDATITLAAPLAHVHAAGASVSGTGIALVAPISKDHPRGAQVSDNTPTPGEPNKYSRSIR